MVPYPGFEPGQAVSKTAVTTDYTSRAFGGRCRSRTHLTVYKPSSRFSRPVPYRSANLPNLAEVEGIEPSLQFPRGFGLASRPIATLANFRGALSWTRTSNEQLLRLPCLPITPSARLVEHLGIEPSEPKHGVYSPIHLHSGLMLQRASITTESGS